MCTLPVFAGIELLACAALYVDYESTISANDLWLWICSNFVADFGEIGFLLRNSEISNCEKCL